MSTTTTSTINAGVNIYYDKKFLRKAANVLRVAQWGQKRDLPEGEGKTIQFFRYNAIPVSIAKLTEGSNPGETNITGQDLQAVISEYGAFSKHASLLKKVHIDRKLAGISSLWGEHAGKTVDLLTQMEIAANGAYPYRCDGEVTTGDYVFVGTLTGGSSSTALDSGGVASNTDYGNENHDLLQSVITILTGTGKGQARVITTYATSGGVMTVSPDWDVAPVSGDTYIVVSAHGLTSSDVITTGNIRGALEILKNNGAAPYEDGFYVGLLSPTTEKNLMADTDWKALMDYSASDSGRRGGMFTGKIGTWGGVHWYYTTQPFKFPITTVGTNSNDYGVGQNDPTSSEYTNYSATGDVYANFVFGKEAFGVTTFKGQGNVMKPGIIVKRGGPQDTGNPLNMFSTVGWYLPYVAKALNPLFAIQMWSGA